MPHPRARPQWSPAAEREEEPCAHQCTGTAEEPDSVFPDAPTAATSCAKWRLPRIPMAPEAISTTGHVSNSASPICEPPSAFANSTEIPPTSAEEYESPSRCEKAREVPPTPARSLAGT